MGDYRCSTCGKRTSVCFTDQGWLGFSHGMYQCRDCYLKSGHKECVSCNELLYSNMEYCFKCGYKQLSPYVKKRSKKVDKKSAI